MQMAPDRKGLSAAHIARSVGIRCEGCRQITLICIFSHSDDTTVLLEETLGLIKSGCGGKISSHRRLELHAARLAQALEVSRKSALLDTRYCSRHYNLYARSNTSLNSSRCA